MKIQVLLKKVDIAWRRMAVVIILAFIAQPIGTAMAATQPENKMDVSWQTQTNLQAQATRETQLASGDEQLKTRLGTRFAGLTREGNTTTIHTKGTLGPQEQRQLQELVGNTAPQTKLLFRAVQHSKAELDSTVSTMTQDITKLKQEFKVSMVGVDEATNEVVVGVEGGSAHQTHVALQKRYPGVALRVQNEGSLTPHSQFYSPGTFKAGLHIDIGDGATHCTSAFSVRDRNNYRRAISAGHCLKKGINIKHGNSAVGARTIWQYGGDMDAGLFALAPTSSPWLHEGNGLVPIYAARYAAVNEIACFSGITSGKRCGPVTATNVSFVNTDGVVQQNMDCMRAVSQGGDSGAPVYINTAGVGILSGTTSTHVCYTPLRRILDRWGLRMIGYDAKVISPRHTGKCLDINLGDYGNASGAQQWTCWNGDNQAFYVEPVYLGNNLWSDDWSLLRAVFSGRCLDFNPWQSYNGGTVYQWDCHGGDMQQFRFVRQAGTTGPEYAMQNRFNYRCIDVDTRVPNIYADGNRVQQWDCHTGSNQTLRLFERSGL